MTIRQRAPSAVLLGGTAAHLVFALLAASSSIREHAKDWSWAWSPLENWNLILTIVPLLTAASIATIAFKDRKRSLGALNVAAAFGWSVLLVLQLLSTRTID